MTDFFPRQADVPVQRTDRVTPVQAVPPVVEVETQSGTTGQRQSGNGGALIDPLYPDIEQQLSSAADVAEAQAKIQQLLAEYTDLNSRGKAGSAGDLEASITALLPTPTVIVPMPPANKETVERAVAVAESMRRLAALTVAAQANVQPEAVETIVNS